MGTEPARLQERLEAALGPESGIEREVRLAARLRHPHVVHTPTEVGTALGTPASMVPEQVTGDPAMDHYANRYSLGVLTDELLVRSHPFAARAPRAATAVVCAAATKPARFDTPRDTREADAVATQFRKEYSRGRLPPPTGGRFK